MESRVELGSSANVDYEMKLENTHRPVYKNMGFLVAVGLVMAGCIAAAVSIPFSSNNGVNIAGESTTQTMSRSKRQVTEKSITTINTGLFGAVANYDERRGLFVDALRDENELWYGKDVELLLSDKEWTTRYPYAYFFNKEEMKMRENGEDVPSLCPTKTIGALLQLVNMESCKDKFNAAIDMTGKGYEDLVDDLFTLLECWEVEAPVMFDSIYNDKSCYGCLINAGSSGNIKRMANCMRGSTKRLPNDQAFESFLYGLALWSKVPLTNNEGNTLEWAVVPRAYISAEYEVDGVKGGIVCTHVAVEGKEQQTQFETITNHVAAREAEGVTEWLLAGDLNCGPKSAAVSHKTLTLMTPMELPPLTSLLS
ncbi:hypothetical protein SARC_08047 [Sphaeroforma arctica JP610]|uniref:Endonuclease/exonuclease/phosphatase domain-containing protein n=1 Tax=Sphaeroforma arctica JP610 TaxID=667725 RepID=A0A0L0FSM1_9EUKA|nr:hypothetical protein SARC_08047 [Sphaeroforma arctica JP610]KNC79561.1 hypothetical protein SARC_08047 [Sphaeroforma arctica JP610]|eukprot:XP_014153463.1 hypothetical protein SARC_08047 [Sphaeroforma arctica JP610]